jgi:luciferase-like monooxygenase
MTNALEKVKNELLSWPGVKSKSHRFGGTEFDLNGREMGHMHGSSWADLPFPMDMRKDLVEKGMASPHHILPNSGWVTFHIRSEEDVETLIRLFKMQYERLGDKK